MRHFLKFILLISVSIGCQTKKHSQPDKFQLLLPDTSKTHKPNNTFDYLVDRSKQLDLPKLDTGVNGIKIRLWIESMTTPSLLVSLNITDTSVTAQKFYYKIIEYGIVMGYKDSTTVFKEDSLQLLAEELHKIDFPKMISQSEIANFNDNVADGMFYNLEIATSKYYKLLMYHCPEHFAEAETNNKRFLEIIFLLDRYLHFYSPICKP